MIGKNQIQTTSRKAGAQVPEHVLAAIARRFPDVRLMWENVQHRWVLVQVRPGERPWPIRVLRGKSGEYVAPTLANTLHVLEAAHYSHIAGPLAQQRLEAQMDSEWAALQNRYDHREEPRRRELSDRIYDVYKPRTVITKD